MMKKIMSMYEKGFNHKEIAKTVQGKSSYEKAETKVIKTIMSEKRKK